MHELRVYKTARLTAMLFTHAHISNRHTLVYRLAHVVNRQQGYLHGGEGFEYVSKLYG